ncbi:helix-turn-helix domain-containing protein [Lactococcus nasutitermitis]|uniref:Helix-turn-helix domain-containing protein n=1 Tax=Lactococcus nasutitermitis TaxID=1652957 RepID=A0ABV9JB29_9LACT|nr:helix-turn-helix domain-containing protein [Lactococcus nasutitermitis]
MTFGENLQKARIVVNLTQEEVAEKIFVTRQTISRWETDRTLPNIYMIKDLSTMYKKTIDELTNGIEHEKRRKLNFFAIFGILAFNTFIGFWLIFIIASLIFALWTILLALAISPFLMIFGIITNNQHFSFFSQTGRDMLTIKNLLVALAMLTIAVVAARYAWLLTKLLIRWLLNYLKFNLKSIYR